MSRLFKLNTLYEIDLGDLSHMGQTHEEMIDHYLSNSSPLSFIMEKVIAKKFDNLTYDPTTKFIDVEGIPVKIMPDLRDSNGNLYDQKAFNRKGGDFVRSKMKGEGRKVNQSLLEGWARAQTFIWTDFLDIPLVRVIGLTGNECLERWPNAKIPLRYREDLFSEAA